jgi:hypothetical protein
MDHSIQQPTIIQCLCYWMMSSIGGKGGFEIPEVGDLPLVAWRERVCTVWDLIRVDEEWGTEVVKTLRCEGQRTS